MAASGALLIDSILISVIIVYIPALLDYLWPLWDQQNQTLHDKVANSIVVRVS